MKLLIVKSSVDNNYHFFNLTCIEDISVIESHDESSYLVQIEDYKRRVVLARYSTRSFANKAVSIFTNILQHFNVEGTNILRWEFGTEEDLIKYIKEEEAQRKKG